MIRCNHEHRVEEIRKLWEEGNGNRKVSKLLNIPRTTLKYLCDKYNLKPHKVKSNRVKLTTFQKQMLIGMILGDAYISNRGNSSYINFAHCLEQKDYLLHKVKKLEPIKSSYLKEVQNTDKRSGKIYEKITYTSLSYKELKDLRNIFYKGKVKGLPIEYLKQNFTAISLAYMYMDDGNYSKYTTTIATCSFKKDELEDFCIILKDKFNIIATVQGNNSIRIKQESIDLFFQIISPYIKEISCMSYKVLNKFR